MYRLFHSRPRTTLAAQYQQYQSACVAHTWQHARVTVAWLYYNSSHYVSRSDCQALSRLHQVMLVGGCALLVDVQATTAEAAKG
jgi:hypothetical protein